MYNWGTKRRFSVKPPYTNFKVSFQNLNISKNWRVDPQLYIVWIFHYNIPVPGEKPYIPNFKVSGRNWNILENRRVNSQLYIVWIFHQFIYVSDVLKLLYTQFKGQRSKLKISWKSTFGPSMLHRMIFLFSNACSNSQFIFEDFFFLRKFSSFDRKVVDGKAILHKSNNHSNLM